MFNININKIRVLSVPYSFSLIFACQGTPENPKQGLLLLINTLINPYFTLISISVITVSVRDLVCILRGNGWTEFVETLRKAGLYTQE